MGASPQFWSSDTALSFSLKAAGSLWLGHPRQRCSVVAEVWEQFSEGEAAFPRLSLVRTISGTPDNGKTVMKYLVTLAYAAGVLGRNRAVSGNSLLTGHLETHLSYLHIFFAVLSIISIPFVFFLL